MSFTPGELKKAIETTLSTQSVVPPGRKGAFIAYVDTSGVRTAIAAKTENGWEVQGFVSYFPHDDGLKIGMNVMKTW